MRGRGGPDAGARDEANEFAAGWRAAAKPACAGYEHTSLRTPHLRPHACQRPHSPLLAGEGPGWGLLLPSPAHGGGAGGGGSHLPKRRRRSELLTTVTDESAIAAAAKIGAFSRSGAMAGEAIASGISTLL